MALFIRDPEVDDLAARLQQITRAPTKTAAVRAALEHELMRHTQVQPLADRLKDVRAKAEALGFREGQSVDFDMKAFTDEMWGE
ncbi:type II toxin-antitoxin system VapB family antitoxin [Castellaniella sp.]|uniref:type II toxin-antitoxin system VapB family antitoxin n=1 Tax=Castellaniella sp. TaxID=1955812 RepID=UPI002AFF0639|nr:type II toxin-antitoxin system VapB family antitoxin [Castellaniella sp.]